MASAFPDEDINGHVNAIMVVLKVFPQIMKEMICNDFPPQIVLKLIQNNRNFKKYMTETMMSNFSSSGYNNLDISSLYHIIRYFKLLPEPKQGWGQIPSPTDISKEDDVERMKNRRNDIIHRRLGDLSELDRNDFFQQSLEIAKRMDSRIGYPQNLFERELEKMRSYMVTQEKYTEALENLVELRETLQETPEAPRFELYYGNNIYARIVAYEDHNERGESRSACSIYLRDPNIDANTVIQKIDEIKEMIRRGNCAISLEGASSGSLKLHVTIHNTSFMTKEKLHKTIHSFLHEFFVAASIPFEQGHIYTVILAESDYLVEDNEKKNDFDFQKDEQSPVLKLNVYVKESAFQNEFVLYREVKSFIDGMYNVVNRHNVPLKGSAREVFMLADNDSGGDSTSSSRAIQESKLRFMPMVSAQLDDDIEGHASAVMIVSDIYPQMIREMICYNWPPNFVLRLIKNEQSFMKHLTHSQKRMISNMERNGYNNLDLSLLYKIIRNFHLVTSPTNGWGQNPKPEDQNEGDDVERMRKNYNDIRHRLLGGLSESERKIFFQQCMEIAKRMDSRIGSRQNDFERQITKLQSKMVSQELYIKAMEKCAKHQARLQETTEAPCFDLYYGNDIKIKARELDKNNPMARLQETTEAPCFDLYYGNDIKIKARELDKNNPMGDDTSSCTIYLKNPDFDVNDVIQRIDAIKEMLHEGSYNISLEHAESGSLTLHVSIQDRCFMSKEILHKAIQLFLYDLFRAASIPCIQGFIYTVILANSTNLVSDYFMKEKKERTEEQKWFVQTKALASIFKHLDEKGLTLVVNPGIGKYMLQQQTASFVNAMRGYFVSSCHGPSAIVSQIRKDTKQLSVLDDAYGKYKLVQSTVDQWKQNEIGITRVLRSKKSI